ncbi:MAG: hypothetical protein Q8R60_14270 [Mycobacteriales bacterium]|nr:hypothetical protein [Mycobacteriales bacterium]
MRLVAAGLALVVAADLVTVAARSGSDDVGSARPAPTASPTAAVPLADADLEGRLPGPGGFTRVDDTASRLGDLTVSGFASRFSSSAAEAQTSEQGLRLLGFEASRGHLWSGDEGLYGCVIVRLATRKGADRLLASSREDATGTFTSATVPGAFTFVDEVEGFSVQHGLFVRDRFVYEVTLTTLEPETDHAVFDRLLLAQRDHAERSDP